MHHHNAEYPQIRCRSLGCHSGPRGIGAICLLFAVCVVNWAAAPVPSQAFVGQWQPHTVQQYNGDGSLITIAAQRQIPTLGYDETLWQQQTVYMPEINRLMISSGNLGLYSDDLGDTWTDHPVYAGDSLTYLGGGNVLGRRTNDIIRSSDYGLSWHAAASVPLLPNGKTAHTLGPMLTDRDPGTGNVVRLGEAVFDDGGKGYVRFSNDGGLTWPTVIDTPWPSEATLIRAANGHIVAAVRTDGSASVPDPDAPYDWRRVGVDHDFYSGLGISISKDNGQTWSPVNQLYDFGRHHPSLVLMPNNDLVMSYVVRLGYDDTLLGLPRYGVEAAVSHDDGQTWDLDRRYVLDTWEGERYQWDWDLWPPFTVKLMAPTTTSTVLLSDGSLMTGFTRGYRMEGDTTPRDVEFVHWRLSCAVPEPSSSAMLIAVAACGMGWFCIRQRQSARGAPVCAMKSELACRVSLNRKSLLPLSMVCTLVLSGTTLSAAAQPDVIKCEWLPHTIRQYRDGIPVDIPARAQVPTLNRRKDLWHHQLIYMPDKGRLMISGGDWGLYSDDLGNTWTEIPLNFSDSLTYLGRGEVLGRRTKELMLSEDHGIHWRKIAAVPALPNGQTPYILGPLLVDRNSGTGNVVRLGEPVFDDGSKGYVRYSNDGGLTWPTVIDTPWPSETTLIRAANGHIVAAVRTDGSASVPHPDAPYDWRRVGVGHDFYSGLGISISKNDGHTWSPVQKLYEFGRHHPSLVLMPDNDLVLSYVVRLGYDDTPEGLPQYGIEAAVSRDNGRTWDLEHRYVLDKWTGQWRERPGVKLMAPATTCSVLLHDGSLVTGFNTGCLADQRTLRLVHWRLNKARHEE